MAPEKLKRIDFKEKEWKTRKKNSGKTNKIWQKFNDIREKTYVKLEKNLEIIHDMKQIRKKFVILFSLKSFEKSEKNMENRID